MNIYTNVIRASIKLTGCCLIAFWSIGASGQDPFPVEYEPVLVDPGGFHVDNCFSLSTCTNAAVKYKESIPATHGLSCEGRRVIVTNSTGPELVAAAGINYQYAVYFECDTAPPASGRAQNLIWELLEPSEDGTELPCGHYLSAKKKNELICTRSNPCNPADGNKFQTEVDYASSAVGVPSLTRFYNSTGSHSTDDRLGAGWRHTYSRSLNEVPDRQPHRRFDAPEDESSTYKKKEDACLLGWNEIKSTVWSAGIRSRSGCKLAGPYS